MLQLYFAPLLPLFSAAIIRYNLESAMRIGSLKRVLASKQRYRRATATENKELRNLFMLIRSGIEMRARHP